MKKTVCILSLLLFVVSLPAQIPNNIYGKKLPYTWEMPMSNIGKMVCTMHTDGTITSKMLTMCFSCNGRGLCGVCGGTGGQYWGFDLGMRRCGYCLGNGRCRGCLGRGYSITQTQTTRSGLTIGWDERGNYYVAGGESSTSRTTRNGIYNCCAGVPTFGLEPRYHNCSNCGETHQIGSHKCTKR